MFFGKPKSNREFTPSDSPVRRTPISALHSPRYRRYYPCCEQNSAPCRESPWGSYTRGFFVFAFGGGNRCSKTRGTRPVKKVP